MFRSIRTFHRLTGLGLAVALLLLGGSGFLLANKDRWEWVKPATAQGGDLATWEGMVPMATVAQAAIDHGLPELRSVDDIDRIELHAGKGVFKVRPSDSYAEVQVCAATGQVLAVGQRYDQLAEHIHDFRWFHPALRDYALPLVALGLMALAGTGVAIYLTPVVRRRRYHQTTAGDPRKDRPPST